MISFVIILWAIVTVADYSEFCYVWQLKEYRWDRFKDFISTKQGKDFLKGYAVSGRLAIFAAALVAIATNFKIPAFVIVILLALELGRYFIKYFKKQIRYPKRTVKAALVVLIPMLLEFFVWYFFKNVEILLAIFGVRFFLLTAVVALFYAPTRIIKKVYVGLATRKLKKYPKLKVIGVTGSYGKTTVKNFLSQILSAEFIVAMTPKNINTEIGVAKFILKTDFSKKNIFIVEMGAYNMGEIKLIANMVKPQIGILTAINEQHLSLFGSIENIQKAKYELLFSLPVGGLAITNSDNPYCCEFLEKLYCSVETFGKYQQHTPNFLIKDAKINGDGSIEFNGVIDEEELEIKSDVIGQHNAMNIAPCILAARNLGMDMQNILEQVRHLELPEGTLRTSSYGESVIIDDSYNANPEGFEAALKILDNYSSDFEKIVITRGMLELGEKSSELHKKIGAEIAKYADELIIINKDSENYLREGVGEKIKIQSIFSAEDLLIYFKALRNKKAVVLIENLVYDVILKEFRKK